MSKAILTSGTCLIALSLAACGGGGGSSAKPEPINTAPTAPAPVPTPAPPPPPPPPAGPTATPGPYDTAEYQNSGAAVLGNALAAYNKGATGLGVRVGVVDSGINPDLSEFVGRIDTSVSKDVAGSRGISDEGGHGTAGSAVIAANKDNRYIHGVAFDATLLNFRADQVGSCATEDGCKFGDSAIGAGVRAAVDGGAKVINLSLGGSAPGSSLLSAFSYAVNNGVVLVISAGNDGEKPEGATADAFAAVPASYFPGMVIVAGSVGTFDRETRTVSATDQLSPFSNRAGSSANNYLSALGAGVKTIDETGGRFFYSGTSFSAPTITGAVALLASAFPNLSGAQIVDILFKSADDLGTPGTDSSFGRGRLNIQRAFQPIGATTLADGSTAVTNATATAPPASGDATTGKSIGAIILDGYSRAFAVDLARSVKSAGQAQPLGSALAGDVRVAGSAAGPVSVAMTVSQRRGPRPAFALEQTGIGPEDLRKSRLIAGLMVARLSNRTALALGFKEGAKSMARRLSGIGGAGFLVAKDVGADHGFTSDRASSMAVRHNLGPASVTFSGETGQVWKGKTPQLGSVDAPYRWTSLAVDRSFGRTWLSAGLGRLDEQRTVLGGDFVSALGGGGSSRSSFLDVEARRDLGGGFSAGLTARRGWTSFAGGSFRSGAYGVDVAKSDLLVGGDRLGLRFAQPLRIENGGLKLLLPTGYNYATQSPTMSWTGYSLSPKGRELDAELSYSRGLWDGAGWIGGNLFARRQPGHFAAADTDLGAAVRFTLGF